MRKILVLILFVVLSCESHLDLDPKMYISAEEAFSNKENVYAALVGCYDALQLQHYYGRNLIIVGDLSSDNSEASGTKIEYYSADDNSLLADNILVEGIWREIYTAINRVNYMLYKLEELDFLSDSERNDYTGQLGFLRALHYFNLVRLYGCVPLQIKPTLDSDPKQFLARTPVEGVYDQIISDLEMAQENISNELAHMATLKATKTLLAMVYLTLGDYNSALSYSNDLLDSSLYLAEDYSELFSHSSEPSQEILFYVPFNVNDKNRMAEYHLPYPLGGRYENSPTMTLVNTIEEKDQRDPFLASEFKDKYYANKYSDLTTGTDKVIVFRTAELIFIKAEAEYFIDSLGNKQSILEGINIIRNRSGIPSIEAPYGGSLWEVIEKERQLEFAFEGKRWFDLIRTNRAIEKVPTVKSKDQMLFPIPLSEILTNPNIEPSDQNPGY